MSVIGLDLSLTSTGIAKITPAGDLVTRTVTSKGSKGDDWRKRNARLADIALSVGRSADAVLYVVEGPAYGATTPSAWDRAGLWWSIVGPLLNHYPVAVVAPTTAKKWATGKGNSDKTAMAAAVARMWQYAELPNSDIVDAIVLASMGAQQLDLPLPFAERAHHKDSRSKVKWDAA